MLPGTDGAEHEAQKPYCKVNQLLFTVIVAGSLLESCCFLVRKRLVYLDNIPTCHSGVHLVFLVLFFPKLIEKA